MVFSLLLDAIRKVVFIAGRLCGDLGITEWRQYRHIFEKIKKQFNFVRKLKGPKSKAGALKTQREQLIIAAHRQYVDLVESYVENENGANVQNGGVGYGRSTLQGMLSPARSDLCSFFYRIKTELKHIKPV